MKTVVFLGPSLPVEVAKTHLDAEFLPPVQQGDVLRVLRGRPDAIGIIDGYFQNVPSVWHKEILTALAEGVHVAGAASMGALRAAELEHFGMAGIGRVFEKFRSGEYTDDDEVAVSHAPAELGYRALSEAMVNIRGLCDAAEQDGVITQSESAELIRIAKSLHFSKRRWDAILAQALGAGLAPSIVDRIRSMRVRLPRGIKERDALALLQHLAVAGERPAQRSQAQLHVEQTVFLADLKREVSRESAPELEEAPGTSLNVARKKVLLGMLASREVVRRGLVVRSDDVTEMTQWFRGTHRLQESDRFEEWKGQHALSEPDFAYAMRRFTEVIRLEESCRPEIEAELDNYLRVYSAAAENQNEMPEWIQLNIALGRNGQDPRVSARTLFGEVLAALPKLKRSGALTRFHFVRKPPDVRLRFQAAESEQYLLPFLHTLFSRQQRSGAIVSVYRSVYEPEARIFGGFESMEAAHDFFHQDCMNWIRWDQIPSAERTMTEEPLCTAVINDLFERVLGCGGEVWDAWHNLAELTRGCKPFGPAPVRGRESLAEIGRIASPPERAVLKRCAKANQEFARSIQRVWDSGRLEVGMRSLLAMIAMFHCNRFGVDGGKQASIAKCATRTWDPHRSLDEKLRREPRSARCERDPGRASRSGSGRVAG